MSERFWVKLDRNRFYREMKSLGNDAERLRFADQFAEHLFLGKGEIPWAAEILAESEASFEKSSRAGKNAINARWDTKRNTKRNTDVIPEQNRTEQKKRGTEPEASPPNYVAVATEQEREGFEEARRLYPGTKRGLDTEFANFKKKHKDWKSAVPKMAPNVHRWISHRLWLEEIQKKDRKVFIPQWKSFERWINGRFWEEEPPTEVIT